MTSQQWTNLLTETLAQKGTPLNADQIAEIQKVIRKAMEDAWSIGNGFDHGFGFAECMMDNSDFENRGW